MMKRLHTLSLFATLALAAALLLAALPVAASRLSAAAVVLAHAHGSAPNGAGSAPQPAAPLDSAQHYFRAAAAAEQGLASPRLTPSGATARAFNARSGLTLTAGAPQPAGRLAAGAIAQTIHPQAAAAQVAAIAGARGLPPADLHALITWSTDRPLGLFGEPTVNLAMLNLALDDLAARRHAE